MDLLRNELEAAYQRITELEKELEGYRTDLHLSSPASPADHAAVHTNKVITRAAAAALALKQAAAAGTDDHKDRPRESGHALRARAKSGTRIEPKLTPRQLLLEAFDSSNPEGAAVDSDPKSGCRVPTPKAVPRTSHQFIIPLQPKPSVRLPVDVATSPVLPPPSPTTSSNGGKKAPQKSGMGKRTLSATGAIGKTSRKERCGIVAKCTEPRQGQTRYWTEDEHERFLEAVAQYGEKAYVAISNYVETRTPKQVRTHAQKFQMKMARLARERCEAGEIMELPPGMLPISIGIDPSKVVSTPPASMLPARSDVTAAQQEQRITALPSSASPSPETSDASGCSQVASMFAEAVSSVSDVSCEDLTDPYLNYIGGEVVRDEVSELEHCFAAKLPKTWESTHLETKQKLSVLSEAITRMDTSVGHDDDLEDLEECGELPMASLSNFGI